MKIILEYEEVIRMLERELKHPINQDDIKISADPFSIEICGLNLEQVIQLQATRQETPELEETTEELEAEKPLTEKDNTKEIARMLGENEKLAHTGGGAGVPISNNVPEIPTEFLPPGAFYDSPGEMSQDEIRGKRR